ncbi:MAG: thioredoxin TrxC [Deltaproteobacteria bacterium]|nr:thioredoxin TrxC [Deltaproteobacteria bacterium]
MNAVCPRCQQVNRIPEDKPAEKASCGRCHASLFDGHPVQLDESSFERHIQRSDVTVLVDFWSPRCGPCMMMAPVFEQAAGRLEPRVRLAKLNTDAAPGIAARHGIQAIPTLILFADGRELARSSGAMSLEGLLAWVDRQLGANG